MLSRLQRRSLLFVYLCCVLIGLSVFFAWWKADQEMLHLATAGAAGTYLFPQQCPWLNRMMAWTRVDLFYPYGTLAGPQGVLNEFWFQMRVQQRLALTLAFAGVAGLLNCLVLKSRLRYGVLVFKLLILVGVIWQTCLIGFVVMRTPRYAPVLPVNTVDNFLYQWRYFGEGDMHWGLVLPQNDGGVIPSPTEADIHLVLRPNGDLKIGTALFSRGGIKELFQKVTETVGTGVVYIWLELESSSDSAWSSIEWIRQEFPDFSWFVVVETGEDLQGHPELRAIPLDAFLNSEMTRP